MNLPTQRTETTIIEPDGYAYVRRPMSQVQFVRAEVRSLRERGYIETEYRMAEIDGYAVAQVRPLRRLPRPMKLRYRVMAWAAMAFGSLAGVGYLLWESRWIIAAAAGTLLALAALIALGSAAAGRGSCSGVHVRH